MSGTMYEFLLQSQPDLPRCLVGKGACCVSGSPEVENPMGKGARDGTTLTHLCPLPSHDPNLLLCEMGPVTPTPQSVGHLDPVMIQGEENLVRKYTHLEGL